MSFRLRSPLSRHPRIRNVTRSVTAVGRVFTSVNSLTNTSRHPTSTGVSPGDCNGLPVDWGILTFSRIFCRPRPLVVLTVAITVSPYTNCVTRTTFVSVVQVVSGRTGLLSCTQPRSFSVKPTTLLTTVKGLSTTTYSPSSPTYRCITRRRSGPYGCSHLQHPHLQYLANFCSTTMKETSITLRVPLTLYIQRWVNNV